MKRTFFDILLLIVFGLLATAQPIPNSDFDIRSDSGQSDIIISGAPDSVVVDFTDTDISGFLPNIDLLNDTPDFKNTLKRIEEPVQPEISIFPNPATNFITISPSGITADLKINIYNSLGKLVKLCRMNNVNQTYDIQLNGLQRGIYFVKLLDGHKVVETKKLVIRSSGF
ncbi:MAG: T9SS type A sorting domain-containing protein [Bacteroidota bacterium]|nr:T9SS type A sorting domain-containing protein [Bacteroidota bacterium]